MNLEKEQALRARAKELDQDKLKTVLTTLRALYPEGKKEAPTLIPVLAYLADVMQAVLDEDAE